MSLYSISFITKSKRKERSVQVYIYFYYFVFANNSEMTFSVCFHSGLFQKKCVCVCVEGGGVRFDGIFFYPHHP